MVIITLEVKIIRRGVMRQVTQIVCPENEVKENIVRFISAMIYHDKSDSSGVLDEEMTPEQVEAQSLAIAERLMAENRRCVIIGIAQLDWKNAEAKAPAMWSLIEQIADANW